MDLPPVEVVEQSVYEAVAPRELTSLRLVAENKTIAGLNHSWSSEGVETGLPDDDMYHEQFAQADTGVISEPILFDTTDNWTSEDAEGSVTAEDALAFDDSLSMGGRFYGMPGSGWKTGNGPIALQSARRFMAERSGDIVAVRHNNRTLSDSTIKSRCDSGAPDSVWCKCEKANLDKYSCGYTLSNSYSVGNGGSILVEIRADDGSENHAPSETVLGSAVAPYVPMEISGDNYPQIALAEPVWLEAGAIYHIVYRNVNPPDRCKLYAVSVSAAASCPRNQGAISLNGVTHQVNTGPTARFGPFLGNTPAVLYRSSSRGSWRTSEKVTSWYEVQYDDGTWVGDTVVAYDAHRGDGKQRIQGNVRARQVFTVTDAGRKVDGLWLNYGHTTGADGNDLLVELKDVHGQVLTQGHVPFSTQCHDIVKSADNNLEEGCRAWGYSEFASPVELLLGSSYSVELSTSSQGGFMLSTYFTLRQYGSHDRNGWHDARAELSRNGGSAWDEWATRYTERDLPMLFTIEGQPRQMHKPSLSD